MRGGATVVSRTGIIDNDGDRGTTGPCGNPIAEVSVWRKGDSVTRGSRAEISTHRFLTERI